MRSRILLFMLLAALPGLAAAQGVPKPAPKPKAPAPKLAKPEPKEEIAYVRRWFGTVRAVVQGSGTSAPARDGSRTSWSVDRRAEAHFTVEMPEQLIAARSSVDESIQRGKIPAEYVSIVKKGLNNPVWFGKLTETVMPATQYISESRTGKGQGLARSGTLDTKGREAATLTVDIAKKSYGLEVQFPYDVQGQEWTESSGKQVPKKLNGIQGFKIAEQPITSAAVLSGRIPMPETALNHFKLGSEGTITGHYEWLLTARQLAEVELVIKDSRVYRDFIPKGAADGGAGNALVMEVEFRGGEPGEKLEDLIFRLDNGSMQPGVSLNSPAQPPQQELFDFRFGALENPTGTPIDSPHGAFEIRFENPGRKLPITITSFDCGGWATLEVNGRTNLKRLVYGTLENTSTYEVPIPDCDPGSHIARKWLSDRGLTGKKDTEDVEVTGPTDKSPGDGLSLYEEYRGFHMDGQHDFGDPQKKDMFIRNRSTHSGMKEGIRLFESISGFRVHPELKEAELRQRRINFNSGHAHVVDQHGVIVEEIVPSLPDGVPAYTQPVAGSGSKARTSPKDYLRIMVARICTTIGTETKKRGTTTTSNTNFLATTLAHELFHTVGVAHHGEGDTKRDWVIAGTGTSATVKEDGKPVKVVAEDGQPFPFTQPSFQIFVATPNKQFSGDEECVMRYSGFAAFIPPGGGPQDRVFVGNDDCMGRSLCTSKLGTGANAMNWNGGKPRAGDATNGNCRAQVNLNDK